MLAGPLYIESGTRYPHCLGSLSLAWNRVVQTLKVQNWKRTITYYPSTVEVVHSVDDIVRIVRDTKRYPSPVRVKGSHHSTTRCIVADQGTVILKYHWLETLRSEPPRELRPVSLLGDPVPFISVIDPPRSLLIYNAPGFWRGDSASLHRVAGNRSSPALRATNQQ